DKVLIVCKTNKSNTYTYKGAYIVTELKQERDVSSVISNGNCTLNAALGGTIRKLAANHTLTFTRILGPNNGESNGDTVKILQMSFKNENQKQAWADAFRAARENSNPPVGTSQHHVHFSTFKEKSGDEWPPCCAVCHNYLKGMFFQGYKCDRCNRCFHKDCLAADKCAPSKCISQSSSFTSVSSLGSAIDPRRLISVHPGEQVATRCRHVVEGHLDFEKNEALEILQVHGSMMATLFSFFTLFSQSSLIFFSFAQGQHRSNSTAGLNGHHTGNVIIRKHSVALPDRPAPSIISPMEDYVNTEITGHEWFLDELSR
ncbi:hypothetical protein PMAYCL1PPCAC_04044, partial [Pristionchus mayeri]